jgi:hypothetical protein
MMITFRVAPRGTRLTSFRQKSERNNELVMMISTKKVDNAVGELPAAVTRTLSSYVINGAHLVLLI